MIKLTITKLLMIVLIIAVTLTGCNLPFPSRSSQQPKVNPTVYTVMLICDDCAQAGMNINVWQNAGTSRGNVVFSVPHQTSVNVVGSKTADDGRLWYNVEYNGKTGWIAKDFVNQ
jgi:hypothetical protein